jgi:Ni,Fe-hydrogenase III small subunit
MSFYTKILTTPRVLITPESILQERDAATVGMALAMNIKKLFGGSLAIRAVDAGSSNAEEQELTALTNPYYDVERFGIHFVASPRHADMLMVTGAVSRNMAGALKDVYEATPDPKIVVAVGNDAIDGGIFKGSYAVLDGVHSVIPVHFQIPGDPPSPRHIIAALLYILEMTGRKGQRK